MDFLVVLLTFLFGFIIPIVFYFVVMRPLIKEDAKELERLLFVENENKVLKDRNYIYKKEIKKLNKIIEWYSKELHKKEKNDNV